MSRASPHKPSIVLVSQWFPPEHAPIGHMIKELAAYAAQHGWQAEVLTGFPNHPTGRVELPYEKRLIQREFIDGIDVTRLWLYTSERRSFLTRSLNFLSFTLSVFLYLLVLQPRPRLVFAVLQPLPMGAVLSLLAKLRGFKLVFNVQDLHPDVMIDLGLIRNRAVLSILKWIERTAYRRADGLAVICEGFGEHVRTKGGRDVAVIPNWIDVDVVKPEPTLRGHIRELIGIAADAPLALYAGTIGHVSGATVVIEAARMAPEITWLFVGDGPLLPELRHRARECPNVRFLPFQPREMLPAVQNCPDVSLVSLLPGKGAFSVPSKVLGYMAAAIPVVASVDADSETARLVRGSGCGLVVPAGDAAAMVGAVRSLVGSPSRAGEAGRSGRVCLESNYARAQVCGQYLAFFNRIVT